MSFVREARSGALQGVVTAVLIALYLALSAFSLSGGQVVERDFGRYEHRLDLGGVTTVEPGGGDPATVVAAARRAGAGEVSVVLTSLDVRAAAVEPPLARFLETDWERNPFPDRFALTSGRWPTRAGEVVAVGGWSRQTILSVLAGNHTLEVVGWADDRYSGWDTLLAARGSFDRVRVPGVVGTQAVYWSGGDQAAVVGAVATAAGTSVSEVGPWLADRWGVGETQRRTWLDRVPTGYRLPAIAVPALVAFAVFGRRRGLFAQVAALLGWTVVGTGVGLGVGSVARSVVAGMKAEPLAPVSGVIEAAGYVAASGVVGLLLAWVWFRVVPPAASGVVRRCLSIVLVGASVLVLSTGAVGAVFVALLGAAVLLFLPELLRRGSAVTAAAMATALAAPLALATLLGGDLAAQGRASGLVLPGQVLISDPKGFTLPPPKGAVDAVTSSVRFPEGPIYLRFSGEALVLDSPGDVARVRGRALTEDEEKALLRGRSIPWDEPMYPVPAKAVALAANSPAARSDGGVLFTSVPEDVARAAEAAALNWHLDHRVVTTYTTPVVETRAEFTVALTGLAVLCACTVAGLAWRRPQSVRAVGTSALVAIVVGVGGTAVVIARDGDAFGLPWGWVVSLLAVYAVSALLGVTRRRVTAGHPGDQVV